MIRRIPLPTTMRYARSSSRRRGQSARTLLLRTWKRTAVLCVFIASCGASECLDPPRTFGRYTHRYYHAAAGAVIGFAAMKIEHAVAPDWCARHPILAQLVAEAPVVAAAVGKEVVDRSCGNEPLHHSAMDVAVTSLGGVVGIQVAIRF